MFDETHESIAERLDEFTMMDAGICKALANACLVITDDVSALELFRKIREHVSITDAEDRMFEVEYYLDYVKHLVEITAVVRGPRAAKHMREEVRDVYEVFLYNRELLADVLEAKRKEDELDEFRSNYYLN